MYLVYLVSHSCQGIIKISWKAPYPPSNGQNAGEAAIADSTISWMIYFKLLWVISSQENSTFPTSVLCLSPLGLFYLSIRHQSTRNLHFKHQLKVGKMHTGSLSMKQSSAKLRIYYDIFYLKRDRHCHRYNLWSQPIQQTAIHVHIQQTCPPLFFFFVGEVREKLYIKIQLPPSSRTVTVLITKPG